MKYDKKILITANERILSTIKKIYFKYIALMIVFNIIVDILLLRFLPAINELKTFLVLLFIISVLGAIETAREKTFKLKVELHKNLCLMSIHEKLN